MDEKWYRSKIMRPDDKDLLGNEGTFYPNPKYRLVLLVTKKDIKEAEFFVKLGLK